MSDHVVAPSVTDSVSHSRRGQSVVEFALVLPILLILLVGAIDLGRVFFGWVALTNAARVGANFAADNATWTAEDQADYVTLIETDAQARNCDLVAPPPPVFSRGGTVVADPALGDFVTATLTCDFALITPLAAQVLGRADISVEATSTFPVRDGCASCPPPPPAPPPTAPVYCREVPVMAGMSVAGARAAWTSAGFSVANFVPTVGDDTRTVESVAVTENDITSNCSTWTPGTWAIFSSDALATLSPADPSDPSCLTVPNMIGMTVGSARSQWTAALFTGTFDPPGDDLSVVTAQDTDPTTSTPGVSCIPPESNVSVTFGPAWAAPPPAPCRVPNFSDKRRNEAQAIWTAAGFGGAITFNGSQGNWKIQRQSLVGGDWVDCAAGITLYEDP
ncbi:MAG: TadE/TadG family type IV pilus assembly protein [Candidatus Limnocylindria bacterium]